MIVNAAEQVEMRYNSCASYNYQTKFYSIRSCLLLLHLDRQLQNANGYDTDIIIFIYGLYCSFAQNMLLMLLGSPSICPVDVTHRYGISILEQC